MNRLSLLTLAVVLFAGTAVAADKKIERLYKSKCGSCHGMDGKAQTEKGKKMKMHDISTEEWQKKWSDADIKKVIEEGVAEEKEGVKKEMDGYKELSAEQMDGLVAFIREMKK